VEFNITESVQKYRGLVFRVALGYVRSIHDADDVTQNVFVKLMTKGKAFDSAEAEKAWLIRVAINESKNLLKSAWFRKTTLLDESLAAPESDNLHLYEYVKKLKPKYRTVIYLHYYEKYTAKEIAVILKMPQNTVLTQLKRARGQLKTIIEKEDDFYGKQGEKIYGVV
jgi:RNA polymerase sigma-70 factor (ECF subfamily)